MGAKNANEFSYHYLLSVKADPYANLNELNDHYTWEHVRYCVRIDDSEYPSFQKTNHHLMKD